MQQFQNLEHDDNDLHSISNNRVNSILKDSNGFLWIGTDEGLDQYIREKKQFRHHNFKTNKPYHDQRGQNVIRTIAEDDQGLFWLGTAGSGLIRYNPENNQYQYFQDKDQIGLTDNSIFYVLSGQNQKIWIATFKGGLNCFDSRTGRAKAYMKDPDNKNSIGTNSLRSLHQDKTGRIWIGSQDYGLITFECS